MVESVSANAAAAAAVGTLAQSMQQEVGHCPAETSTDSGVGAWYQFRKDTISVSVGIETLYMTTSTDRALADMPAHTRTLGPLAASKYHSRCHQCTRIWA